MPAEKHASGTHRETAMSSIFREDETDDGWIVLRAGPGPRTTTPKPAIRSSKPPRPPPRNPSTSTATAASWAGQPFDPAPEAFVGRYLPARRALRCDALPPEINDADIYAFHPAFLASVYPPAAANDSGNDRPEWFFFACRGRGLGGKRRAGPGAYRLAGEQASFICGGGGSAGYYRHAFRYHEDDANASAARETEWRMDEYGDHDDGPGAGPVIDMVVCKVYPARGGALHATLRARALAAERVDVKPQLLVQLHLASARAGDALRCRVHRAADVFASHPAILTNILPAANDRFEWFFAVRRARCDGGGGRARARRAGPGEYVPVGNDRCVTDGRGRVMGYRRVFRYREDGEAVRHVSRTAWWMEEYGFGPDFPLGERVGDEVLVVYKVYLRMGHR